MSDWDGLRLCEVCGEYTTSRVCWRCREQEAIDNDPLDWLPLTSGQRAQYLATRQKLLDEIASIDAILARG